MSLPIFAYASTVTTNIAICTLIVGLPNTVTAGSQSSYPMIDQISFVIVPGSTGVGTTVTWQELGADSTPSTPVWRALVTAPFAPIVLANSTTVNGPAAATWSGFVFHGLRMQISSATGNGIVYAELKATVRT